MPHSLKPVLWLLEGIRFPLEHRLFPFEADLSGLQGMLSRPQPPRDFLQRMRSGMKPEVFRLQPRSHFLELLQPRLQREEHGLLRPPHPKEDPRCPAPELVSCHLPAVIRLEAHPKLGYLAMDLADKPVSGRVPASPRLLGRLFHMHREALSKKRPRPRLLGDSDGGKSPAETRADDFIG